MVRTGVMMCAAKLELQTIEVYSMHDSTIQVHVLPS